MNAPYELVNSLARAACGMNVLSHINELASIHCVDDISRREKLSSIQMLSSEILAKENIDRSIRMPVHEHEMTIGEGRGLVTCCFDVSDEGDIENLQVLADGRDIFKFLPESQICEIEAACWADYVGECKQNNDDIRINNYEAGL